MIFTTDENLLEKLQAVEGPYNEIIWVNNTIYGSGGLNRYYISDDNEVMFSAYHSNNNGIEKAKKAGFRIFA